MNRNVSSNQLMVALLDARRASANDLAFALNWFSRREISTIVFGNEGLDEQGSPLAHVIFNEADLQEIIDKNRTKCGVLYVADFQNLPSYFEIARAGKVHFNFTNSDSTVWTKCAFLPVGFLNAYSTLDFLNLLSGKTPLAIQRLQQFPTAESFSGYPNLLFVSHTDLDNGSGGVQVHLRALIDVIKVRQKVYFLTSCQQGFLLRSFSSAQTSSEVIPFLWGRNDPLKNPAAEKKFAEILISKDIEVVHFHHLQNLCWSLVEVSKKSVRTIITLHDYFSFCRRYDLLNPEGAYCNFCKVEANCQSVSAGEDYSQNVGKYSASSRRRKIKDVLRGVKKIVPSENTKQLLVSKAGFVASEIEVLEIPIQPHQFHRQEGAGNHNGAYFNGSEWVPDKTATGGQLHLNIAFLGVFSNKKGSHLFSKIVQDLHSEFPKVTWTVFGKVDDAALADFLTTKFGVRFLGPYQNEKIVGQLREERIDVGLILSIWPETFSITLSEFFESSCPVIVTNLGAPADRVSASHCGWIVDVKNPTDQVKEIFKLLQSNPSVLKEKRDLIPLNPYSLLLEKYFSLYLPSENPTSPIDIAPYFLRQPR